MIILLIINTDYVGTFKNTNHKSLIFIHERHSIFLLILINLLILTCHFLLGSARLSKAAIYTELTADAANHRLPLVH